MLTVLLMQQLCWTNDAGEEGKMKANWCYPYDLKLLFLFISNMTEVAISAYFIPPMNLWIYMSVGVLHYIVFLLFFFMCVIHYSLAL